MKNSQPLATIFPNFILHPISQQLSHFSYHLILHKVTNQQHCNIMIQQLIDNQMSFRQTDKSIYNYNKNREKQKVYVLSIPYMMDARNELANSIINNVNNNINVNGNENINNKNEWKKNNKNKRQRSHQVQTYSCKYQYQQCQQQCEKDSKMHEKYRSQQNSARASLNTNTYHHLSQQIKHKYNNNDIKYNNSYKQNPLHIQNIINSNYFIYLLQYATTLTMPLQKHNKSLIKNKIQQLKMQGQWKKSNNYYKLHIIHHNHNTNKQYMPFVSYLDINSLQQININNNKIHYDSNNKIQVLMQQIKINKIVNAYKYCIYIFDTILYKQLLQCNSQQIINQYNKMIKYIQKLYNSLVGTNHQKYYNNNNDNKSNNSKSKSKYNNKQVFKLALQQLLPQQSNILNSVRYKQNTLSMHRNNYSKTQRINSSLFNNDSNINIDFNMNFNTSCQQSTINQDVSILNKNLKNMNNNINIKQYSLNAVKKYISHKFITLANNAEQQSISYQFSKQYNTKENYKKKCDKQNKQNSMLYGKQQYLLLKQTNKANKMLKTKQQNNRQNNNNNNNNNKVTVNTNNSIIDSEIKQVVQQNIKQLYNEYYSKLQKNIKNNEIQIYKQIINKLGDHIDIDYKCKYLINILVQSIFNKNNKQLSNNNNINNIQNDENQNIVNNTVIETNRYKQQEQQIWHMEDNSQLVIISRIQPLNLQQVQNNNNNNNNIKNDTKNNKNKKSNENEINNINDGDEMLLTQQSILSTANLFNIKKNNNDNQKQNEVNNKNKQIAYMKLYIQQLQQNLHNKCKQLQQYKYKYNTLAKNNNKNNNNENDYVKDVLSHRSSVDSDRYIANKIQQLKKQSITNSRNNSTKHSKHHSLLTNCQFNHNSSINNNNIIQNNIESVNNVINNQQINIKDKNKQNSKQVIVKFTTKTNKSKILQQSSKQKNNNGNLNVNSKQSLNKKSSKLLIRTNNINNSIKSINSSAVGTPKNNKVLTPKNNGNNSSIKNIINNGSNTKVSNNNTGTPMNKNSNQGKLFERTTKNSNMQSNSKTKLWQS